MITGREELKAKRQNRLKRMMGDKKKAGNGPAAMKLDRDKGKDYKKKVK